MELSPEEVSSFKLVLVLRIPMPLAENLNRRAKKKEVSPERLVMELIEAWFLREEMDPRAEWALENNDPRKDANGVIISDEDEDIIYYLSKPRTLDELQSKLKPDQGLARKFLNRLEARGFKIKRDYKKDIREFLFSLHPEKS